MRIAGRLPTAFLTALDKLGGVVMVFWMIFKKDDSKEFEIAGQTRDDTQFTNQVCSLQQRGFHVRCETPLTTEISRDQILTEFQKMGYNEIPGLYKRLIQEP